MKGQGIDINSIFNAAQRAGNQVVENGIIEEDVFDIISGDLMRREQYVDIFKEPL